ncbi:MAG: hypothetical protein JWM44_3604 [Bacilli bacterium]|nr:hypothetical protein [Bacilli bacterium]
MKMSEINDKTMYNNIVLFKSNTKLDSKENN